MSRLQTLTLATLVTLAASCAFAADVYGMSQSERDAQERAAKAGERRFITNGTSSANLRARLGPPDATEYEGGGECWIYEPSPNDQQTRRRICFKDGVVYDVQRTIQR